MNRFDPKAIAIAVLLSLALDVLGGLVLLAVFGTELDTGLPPEQLSAALDAIAQGSGFLLAALLFSTATTTAGGYIAARLARAYPYFNAMAVGVVGIVLGLVLSSSAPWWFDALGYLISIPAALLGGHLASRRNQ
ncbi:MAG: hypothetical protein IV105_12015 [Rhizobacter sp.]|nr:hypothetical protein [Rhizobacter sp.]